MIAYPDQTGMLFDGFGAGDETTSTGTAALVAALGSAGGACSPIRMDVNGAHTGNSNAAFVDGHAKLVHCNQSNNASGGSGNAPGGPVSCLDISGTSVNTMYYITDAGPYQGMPGMEGVPISQNTNGTWNFLSQ